MNRRSSSTSSLARPPDFTKTVPFVPREVFRLVLRLEAQKALDVNVAALEQRFRVPSGYADDDSLNARGEVKQPKNVRMPFCCLVLPCAGLIPFNTFAVRAGAWDLRSPGAVACSRCDGYSDGSISVADYERVVLTFSASSVCLS